MRNSLAITLLASVLVFAAPARGDVDIPTANPCQQLVTNSVTNRIYARCANDLVEIDGETHAQRALPLTKPLVGVDPVGNRVIASDATGITVVDVPSWTATAYPVAGSVALDPAEGAAWIAQASAGQVLRFDLATGATTPYPLGSSSTNAQVTIDPVQDLVYVGFSPLARVVELDPATGATRSADFTAPVSACCGTLAMDPLRRELFVSVSAWFAEFGYGGPAIATVDTETMTVIPPTSAGDENPLLPATDPGNGRLWIGAGQFLSSGVVSALRLSDGAFLGNVAGAISDPGQWTVDPATGRAYVAYYNFVPAPFGAGFVARDFDPLGAPVDTALPNSQSGRPAVVLSTNRLYLPHSSFLGGVFVGIREHEPSETAPVPLPVSITPGLLAPGGSLIIHFSATSGWPTGLPVQQIFYQVDSVDGAWTPATPAGPTASATVPLVPGTRFVHAFAVDGQEASLGHVHRTNPVTGPVATLDLATLLPACGNGVDDDGDGLVDHPADPGCRTATSAKENPQCDDDADNDGDGGVDWDGGPLGGAPDTLCVGAPWRDRESPPATSCGLGAEVALAGAALAALRRRTRLHRYARA